uniref:Uncharacterized protein n=1 Tax=Nephromyces sp. ex Molgula occidentalis TaxID=2544991 RepID=A0A5C1H8C8_9APIC|nr:hypothetical protein [Nephromyces sp. ex Molgula occidentalis]
MIKELFPNLINFEIKKIKYINNIDNKISLLLYLQTSLDKCFIKNILEYFLNKKIISINIKKKFNYKIIYIKFNFLINEI